MNTRKIESMWPVHQINWQKSRYIYDLYYTHHRIDKKVYQYCIDQKLIDAALIAKWKKKGYERLCSTYVINPSNYKFSTTSICRVPWFDRNVDQKQAKDPTVRHSYIASLPCHRSQCLYSYHLFAAILVLFFPRRDIRRDVWGVLPERTPDLTIYLETNTGRI